jgi:hypothetical protein
MARTKQTARQNAEKPARAVKPDDQKDLDRVVNKECEVCRTEKRPVGKYSKATLTKHRKAEHPEYQLAYKCPKCGQNSRRRAQIEKHLSNRHEVRRGDPRHPITEQMLTKKALAKSCLKRGRTGAKRTTGAHTLSDSHENDSDSSVSNRTRHKSKKSKVSKDPDVSVVKESRNLSITSSSDGENEEEKDSDDSSDDEPSKSASSEHDSDDEFDQPKAGSSKSRPKKKKAGTKVPEPPKIRKQLKLVRPGKAAVLSEHEASDDEIVFVSGEEDLGEESEADNTPHEDFDSDEAEAEEAEEQPDPITLAFQEIA